MDTVESGVRTSWLWAVGGQDVKTAVGNKYNKRECASTCSRGGLPNVSHKQALHFESLSFILCCNLRLVLGIHFALQIF